MTAKHDAEPAWLKLLFARLEKLHVTLRPHAVDAAVPRGVSRKKRKRTGAKSTDLKSTDLKSTDSKSTDSKSSHSRRFEVLNGIVAQKGIALGREFFDPTDEARHDDERCLQRYAEVMGLSPQAQEVFRLNRTEGMEHDEIASYLNVNRVTLEDHLLAIMLAVLQVQEAMDNEGVVKKGP